MVFPKDQLYCFLDFETYSELDIKKAGAYEYAAHPSTDILCAAYAIGTKNAITKNDIKTWTPALKGEPSEFGPLLQAILDPKIKFVAHNAFFEQVITYFVFTKKMYSMADKIKAAIKPDKWVCTASLAAAMALPRSLEEACLALDLPVKKDMEGNRLMLKWCKPKNPSKRDPSFSHVQSLDDPKLREEKLSEFRRLVDYCKSDVAATIEAFKVLRPLSDKERDIWLLDQAINWSGPYIDIDLVDSSLELISEESKRNDRRISQITKGAVSRVTQRDALKSWLDKNGLFLPDMRKETIAEFAGDNSVNPNTREVLKLRLSGSKSSTAKYTAFKERTSADFRVRDTLLYHGAGTGRWSGRGVQLQNLPRPLITDTITACDLIKERDLDSLRLVYDNPMDVISSCIRGAIIAPPGHTLHAADYASIEARGVFWLADHASGLDAYRNGVDQYKLMAADIFGMREKDIAKDSFERFVGKTTILGSGYQMGPKRFKDQCAAMGREISDELAEKAINTYRQKNAPVVKLWSNLERAAMAAVRNEGKAYTINHCTWYKKGDFLWCKLPSGRLLAYPKPSLKSHKTHWGDDKLALHYWGVDSLTKKWGECHTYGGALTENVCQAVCRDVMAEAMLRIAKAGPWRIVLTVHDELVAEINTKEKKSINDFCKLMSIVPDWADGFPIAVEGWEGLRYRK